jgi:hypothetical protein
MLIVQASDAVIVAHWGFTWPARSIGDARALAAMPFDAIPMMIIGIAGATSCLWFSHQNISCFASDLRGSLTSP